MTSQTRGIVGSVLAPACRVWLRSQVSHVEDIQVDIAGGSLQILGGTIPRVAVVASGAIYQGLSLGSIDLVAENIRVNLPQVVKGQPLGLLEPISVTAEVKFSEGDLQASLAAPLLSQAITDLFTQILGANPQQPNWIVEWHQVQIIPQMLILQGNLTTEGKTAPIELSMGIAILDGQILHLDPLKITCSILFPFCEGRRSANGTLREQRDYADNLPGSNITSYQIDLGDDVNITQLQLSAGELLCQGRILINP